MSDIRLTVHLPNHVSETAYVGSDDRLLDFVRGIALRGLLPGSPENYSFTRNNSAAVLLSASFADAGFVNGDELFIKDGQYSSKDNDNDFEEPEISKTFHQLGILVLDGSASMARQGSGKILLAAHVNKAVQEFIEAFKSNSSIMPNVSLAIITFDHYAKIHTAPTPLAAMDALGDYDPLRGHGGGTNIGTALEAAEKLALDHLDSPGAKNFPSYASIIVMSDGQCQSEHNTRSVVNRIKNNAYHQNGKITICASFFKNIGISDSDELKATQLLQEIVSEPRLFDVSHDYIKLRQFFIGSMTAKRMNAK